MADRGRDWSSRQGDYNQQIRRPRDRDQSPSPETQEQRRARLERENMRYLTTTGGSQDTPTMSSTENNHWSDTIRPWDEYEDQSQLHQNASNTEDAHWFDIIQPWNDAEEHLDQDRERMHNIIRNGELGIIVPDRDTQNWSSFSVDTFDQIVEEDNLNEGRSMILADIFQRSNIITDQQRDSMDYRNLMKKVLERWKAWNGW